MDGDGYGGASDSCVCPGQTPPGLTIKTFGDCDDSNYKVRPGLPEVCDGFDNDCDFTNDDGVDFCSNPNCGTCGNVCSLKNAVSSCTACNGTGSLCGISSCVNGHYNLNGKDDDGCEYDCSETGAEVCDGLDNDCNGVTDEGVGLSGCTNYYVDADGDGWGDWTKPPVCACAPPGLQYALFSGDCSDANNQVNPEGTELCDVAGDEDCDGSNDESPCACAAPEKAGPGCGSCAPGYVGVGAGQCGAALPIWGAISGATFPGFCEHPEGNFEIALDRRTGLMWRTPSSFPGAVTPNTGCDEAFGGYSDWRTPTVAELMTVLMTTPTSQTLPICLDLAMQSGLGFPIFSRSYWFNVGGDIHFAPTVDQNGALTFGQAFAAADTSQAVLLCVRGGTFKKLPTARMVVGEAEGTVTDTLTGLVWERTVHDNVLTPDVPGYCESVGTGGHSWRLPTALEAATLLDSDDQAGGFAGGALLNLGGGDLMVAVGILWTDTFASGGNRVVVGPDMMELGAMDDINGGYQIACVRAN